MGASYSWAKLSEDEAANRNVTSHNGALTWVYTAVRATLPMQGSCQLTSKQKWNEAQKPYDVSSVLSFA
jgi:hypothetical protein